LLAGFFERGKRVDAERIDEDFYLLGAKARHPHEIEDGRRHLPLKLFKQRQPTGVEERLDFLSEVAADAVEVCQGSLRIGPHGGERLEEAVYRAGGVPVGPHPKNIVAAIFEQVGDMLEGGSDVGIRHGVVLWGAAAHRQDGVSLQLLLTVPPGGQGSGGILDPCHTAIGRAPRCGVACRLEQPREGTR